MATQIQLRRDTASNWTSNNPTLAAGEFGYETDTTKFKVGDGSTAWNSLAYNTSAGSTTINNATANELVTVAATTTELDAEANLTFDGTTLTLTGSAALDGVTIADNEITTNRSNDTLLLTANGTGRVEVVESLANSTLWSAYNGTHTRIKGFAASIENLSVDADTVGREYGHAFNLANKLTNGSSSNSNWRPRAMTSSSTVDMDGNDYTRTGMSRGPMGGQFAVIALNSNGSTASTLENMRGVNTNAGIADFNTPTQDITVNNIFGNHAQVFVEGNGTSDKTITNGYNFYADSYVDETGSGTSSITNLYGFYFATSPATNQYAFYSASDTAKSRVGTLQRYREEINALTSSSTITVDCGLAPVHTVTLGTNTGFVISNLGTGQSVTIIITQDGTGNRTATFGTDGSTAVKFPGGAPTLSTGAGDIDIVTIFNDGTNYYGNCAKDYA